MFKPILPLEKKLSHYFTFFSFAEALWNVSKSTRTEERERETRRETEASKEKDRYKEKYWGKSIQELDLSNCQRCTPSYRLLPDDVSLLCPLSFLLLSKLTFMINV